MATRPVKQNIFKQLKRTVAHPMCYRAKFRVSAAEINAGIVAIEAPSRGGIRVHDIRLTSTAGTGAGSNVIFTGKQGKATQTLAAFPATSILDTTTIGVGDAGVVATGVLMNLCDSGQPIMVVKSGANITGLSGLDVSVLYSIE